MFECDICGTKKPTKMYECFGDGGFYLGYLALCKDCLPIQEKIGSCVSLDREDFLEELVGK
ncbi:MAG: hypothetical protein MJY47_02080 [Fibrobacter sp.]|nr:hypothetical protein [Fibrobacter sp.]